MLPTLSYLQSRSLCTINHRFKYTCCMVKSLSKVKVSIDLGAKLCECEFDFEQKKLVFSLPSECKLFYVLF